MTPLDFLEIALTTAQKTWLIDEKLIELVKEDSFLQMSGAVNSYDLVFEPQEHIAIAAVANSLLANNIIYKQHTQYLATEVTGAHIKNLHLIMHELVECTLAHESNNA